MRTSTRTLISLLMAGSCYGQSLFFGGNVTTSSSLYAKRATVSFAAASGSAPLTNFTAPFTASDLTLRSVGNGGVLASTSTQNGITVPNDLMFTLDSTCNTITGGMNWLVEVWTNTSGAGGVTGFVKIPTLSNSSAFTAYVCYGRASDTWHGGATGSVYDTNTQVAYEFADSTNLHRDFGSTTNNLVLSGSPAATTGKIGGGGNFTPVNQYNGPNASSTSAVTNTTNSTVEGWIKIKSIVTSDQNPNPVFGLDLNGYPWMRMTVSLYNNGTTVGEVYNDTDFFSLASGVLSTGVWHHVATVFNGSTIAYYVDGVSTGTPTSRTTTLSSATFRINTIRRSDVDLDELRLSTTNRSAGWIATEYASQNSIATLGSFITN